MGLFDRLRNRNKVDNESLEASMSKLREYVDEMPDMSDVSKFRVATAKAIAAHNEMKIEAREHPNHELFELLMPFSEYFLKRVIENLFTAAQSKAVEAVLWVKCLDDMGRLPYNFYYSKEQKSVDINIEPKLKAHDVTYEFQSPLEQWQYYYQLADWLVKELEERGLTTESATIYTRNVDGWNDDMSSLSLKIRWGDDVFVDAVKKFTDTSQVDAYISGVPIEDIVA